MKIESGSSAKSIIIFTLLLTAAIVSGLTALFTFRPGADTGTAMITPAPTIQITSEKLAPAPVKPAPTRVPQQPAAVETKVNAPSAAGADPKQVALGEKLYISKGCIACHALDGRRSIGSTLLGIYGDTRMCRGKKVQVDDKYLQLFMIDPNACDPTAKRPSVMPPYAKAITPDERLAIVSYIRGLRRVR